MKRFILLLGLLLAALTASRAADHSRAGGIETMRFETARGSLAAIETNEAFANACDALRTMRQVYSALRMGERALRFTDAAELTGGSASYARPQSLEEINRTAREQVVRELGLTGRKRREFETLYDNYRKALDRAIEAGSDASAAAGDAAQRQALKRKLSNIASTARVKQEWVDRFAEVLSAEQIRRMYNAEGQISTSIKRASARRAETPRRLKGNGRIVTQDWGPAGAYESLQAGIFFDITVSPTARTISVTADENVIDYLTMKREGGRIAFGIDARNLENITIKVVMPWSPALRALTANTYGKIRCSMPLKTEDVQIDVSSYGAVRVDVDTPGKASLRVSSYGKFDGTVRCNECDYRVSSYGSARGDVVCRGAATLSVGSYARFDDDVQAATIDATISSGGSIAGNLTCSELQLTVGSYAKFTGGIAAKTTSLSVSSGGSADTEYDGGTLRADVGSYGKVVLRGSATVDRASVRISSGGSFRAPELKVTDYDLTASSYAKADVWCSGALKVRTGTGSQVTYDGPCQVDSYSESLRRKSR